MVDTRHAAALLRYWRLVELMTAGKIPETRAEGGDSPRVVSLRLGDSLPWPAGVETLPPLAPGKVWRFRVFGGPFELADVHRALVDRFGDDGLEPEARQEPTRSALYVVELDENGFVVPGSADLSMCAWSVGRALARIGRGLDGFEDDQLSFVDQLDRLSDPGTPTFTGAERAPEPSLRDTTVRRIDDAAREALGAGADGIGDVLGATAGAAASPFVTSVGGGIVAKVVSTFVTRVLTPPPRRDASGHSEGAPHAPKLDVAGLTQLTESLGEALDIEVVTPRGLRVQAFPVDPHNPEASRWFLNGLFAADLGRLEREVRRECGPALAAYLQGASREVAAARHDVVADRSAVTRALAPHRVPAGRWPAATDQPLVRSQQFGVNEVRRQLSSAAGLLAVNGPPGTGKTTLLRDIVADIVTERARRLADLPHPMDAFGSRDHVVLVGDKDTVVKIAEPRASVTGFEIVLGTGTRRAGDNVVDEVPGIEAVTLEDHPPVDYFPALASHVLGRPAWSLIAARLGRARRRGEFAHAFWDGEGGMRRQLTDAERSPCSTSWASAVAGFRTAVATVDRLVRERQGVADAISALPALRGRATTASNRRRSLNQQAVDIAAHLEGARRRRDASLRASRSAEESLGASRRPGAVSWIWRGVRRWRAERAAWEQRNRVRDLAVEEARAAYDEYVRLDRLARAIDLQQRDATFEDREATAQLNDVESRITHARERWGRSVDAGDELDAPWADRELTWARTEVFLSAMRLHHAFVMGAAEPLRRSLGVIVDHLKGNRVRADDAQFRMAWHAFFLVVPVVSTTFASLPTLFRGIGCENLGWLLVDEAGQTTPQQVAGALWRSRRAVVVGDPLQLDPVLPVPRTVMRALGRRAGVSDVWTRTTSAQEVADAATGIGTYLSTPAGEARWVGAPLRVHRRCDRPIFDVFSTMAYGNGLLTFGTPERDPFPGRNEWIDVPTRHHAGKWSPQIQQALVELLRDLWKAHRSDLGKVSVLSPFTETVARIRRLEAAEHLGKTRIGTVHTMQGAEADIVVLVLCTGTAEHRARAWLAESPHLLNVAVSRARRRLYVIGDRSLWSGLDYVDDVARALSCRRAV